MTTELIVRDTVAAAFPPFVEGAASVTSATVGGNTYLFAAGLHSNSLSVLQLGPGGAPLPIKNAGPAKTRQQVIDEMRSESPKQRRARMELTTGG